MKKLKILLPLLSGLALFPAFLNAQTQPTAGSQPLTLDQCITYALQNQPEVKQAQLDEAIGEREIRVNLASWYPQISAQFNAQHNFKLQTTAFGDQLIQIGRKNTSNVLLQANQVIYNNEVLFATRAARYTRLAYDQNTISTKINTVVNVSKAFYAVLLTQEQLRILDENILRLEKQYSDALSRYEVGLVDKTDYQRASITLANTRSERRRTFESVKSRKALLKQYMGLPPESELNLQYDPAIMIENVEADTVQPLSYASRIEIQQLQNQRQLLQLNTSYFRWNFLPNINAFVNYNWLFLNDEFSELYKRSFPTSAAGLSAGIPIFQGTRRLQQIKISKLREERIEREIENTRNVINSEYESALANYKSDYNHWLTQRENAQVAEEVYNIIKLQYDEGIKTYLELVVAELELRLAQLEQYNALYNVLSSKLDLDRALGTVNINY